MAGQRLTREEWLSKALEEIVSTEMGVTLGVRELCQRLDVSAGSFYWHFKDKADFVSNLVDGWGSQFTCFTRP